jgi:hypothetical protein
MPKVDNVETSLAEAPMVLVVVARPGGKEPDDIPCNDDTNLLNSIAAMSWIACWINCLL